jgi:hypothetical protein
MNGQSFLRRPGPTRGCRGNDDDDDDVFRDTKWSGTQERDGIMEKTQFKRLTLLMVDFYVI